MKLFERVFYVVCTSFLFVLLCLSYKKSVLNYHPTLITKDAEENANRYYGPMTQVHRIFEYNTADNHFKRSMTNHSYYELDDSPGHASQFDSDNIDDSEIDLILAWTDFFGYKFLYEQEPNGDLYIYNTTKDIHRPAYCEKLYPNCRVTRNRKYLNKSSLLLFHMYDINLGELPVVRSPEQLWVLYNKESPMIARRLPNLKGVLFNATANYHSSSTDILIPYGEVESRSIPTYRPDISRKYLPIVWFVSHCHTPSRREEYARKLARYIRLDNIGKCWSNRKSDPKRECRKTEFEHCQSKFFAEYYFYFAAENAFCEEYITEKAFSTLKHDIVPIVYGGANYSRALPPNSFIDATKYRPKDLAVYLKSLMENRTAYEEYFQWKKDFIVHNDRHANDHMFCEACRYVQLHKKGLLKRKSISLEQFNQQYFSKCWDSARIHSLFKFYDQVTQLS